MPSSDHLVCTIYHQGLYHSISRNPLLEELSPQTQVSDYSWPHWMSLHLVLGLSCHLVHSRSLHSVESVVFESCNVSRVSTGFPATANVDVVSFLFSITFVLIAYPRSNTSFTITYPYITVHVLMVFDILVDSTRTGHTVCSNLFCSTIGKV